MSRVTSSGRAVCVGMPTCATRSRFSRDARTNTQSARGHPGAHVSASHVDVARRWLPPCSTRSRLVECALLYSRTVAWLHAVHMCPLALADMTNQRHAWTTRLAVKYVEATGATRVLPHFRTRLLCTLSYNGGVSDGFWYSMYNVASSGSRPRKPSGMRK